MKGLLRICLFILAIVMVLPATAQESLTLSRGILRSNGGRYLDSGWRFIPKDDTAFANPTYDDAGWRLADPELPYDTYHDTVFTWLKNTVWFRHRFHTDTSLIKTPLAIVIDHLGASEIYLDGRLLMRSGTIGVPDSIEPFNTKSYPYGFSVPDTGTHVIAVRYANPDAKHNYESFRTHSPGFSMRIGLANVFVDNYVAQTVGLTFLLVLLVGIFTALSITHLFLYLYQRAIKLNLYFSIMCLMLAAMCLVPWMGLYTSDPIFSLSQFYTLPAALAAFCIAFSGFVNFLFSKGRIRFYVIALFCIASAVLYYFTGSLILMFIMLPVVMLEAIVLIILGIIRRVKGARIIGAGMLLFSIFIFITTLYLSVFGSIRFEGESGIVFSLTLGLAILSLPVAMSVYLAWSFAYVNKELSRNLEQVKDLSAKTLQQELEKTRMIETEKERLELEVAARTSEVTAQKEKIEKQHSELKAEKEKSDSLLLNILPAEVADELKEKGYSDAHLYNDVTVMFTDFVGFTRAGERMKPQELVDELHACFKKFDEIISRYNIEKIKTIGDAYLAVCGLPQHDALHAQHTISAAMEIRDFMLERRMQMGERTFEIRIGVHSGSVVAGIVGVKKYAYDIWGDTVNTAARMEQSSEAGRINMSEATYMLVRNEFACTPRGLIDAKNKGELNMYFADREVGQG